MPLHILVTDGNNRAALAITRSLGKAGYRVSVAEKQHPSLASSSRYCSGKFIYFDPLADVERFYADILNIIQDQNIDMILPVTDISTLILSEHGAAIKKRCFFPFPDHHSLLDAADKSKVIQYAREEGVPCPATTIIHDYSGIKNVAELVFPVVVKPARSRVLTGKKWIFTSVTYARNAQELEDILRTIPQPAYPVLLQERVTGPGIGVFVYYHYGKLRAIFGHRRLREKPPSGGVSTLRESINVSQQIRGYTELILNRLNWHGVAMVEFKMDQKENCVKIMEINGRFWGSLQLAIDAGMDFPFILVDSESKEDIEPILTYQTNVKTRWLLGDLDALLLVMTKKRKKLNLPASFPSKSRYLLDFLKFRGKNLHYEIESWQDFRPALYEYGNWLKGRAI